MSDNITKKTQGVKRTIYSNINNQDKAIVVIAHGAGAGNKNEFMDCFCQQLAIYGICVISFNFDYMQIMYETGKRRPPNPNKQLLLQFQQELHELDSSLPVFIAGKSMGGRVASQLAAYADLAQPIRGCIALGYPFMPSGKPEKFNERTQHFASLTIPLLINQGERDTFGNLTSLATDQHKTVFDNANVQLQWITSGDHSFKPLKSSGLSLNDNIASAVFNTVSFINKLV